MQLYRVGVVNQFKGSRIFSTFKKRYGHYRLFAMQIITEDTEDAGVNYIMPLIRIRTLTADIKQKKFVVTKKCK